MLLAGLLIGSILSWTVLSGDSQGRVNLFYLLLVYLFIPLFSVIASVISLALGKGINLARLVSMLPVFSETNKTLLRKVQQLNIDKYWFLYQSQLAAIAYSVSSLFIFFILLLVTDLNFVWRSTVLEPLNILPFLEVIAWPWQFWDVAQPTLSMLETTQDSRTSSLSNAVSNYGVWWEFILATQIFYSFTLRFILMLFTRWKLVSGIKSDIEQTLTSEINNHALNTKETIESSPIANLLPEHIAILNWHNVSQSVLDWIRAFNIDTSQLLEKQSLVSGESVEDVASEKLVIVKSWEAPLGELEDYLTNANGYLFPIDWNKDGLQKLNLNHLQEWQRFVNKLPHWQLYLPESLLPEDNEKSKVGL